MTVRVAGTLIKRVIVGVGGSSLNAKRIMIGAGTAALQAWSAFSAMGMDKAGSQSIASPSAWLDVTGWVVRSGYPDSVIVDNGLVMNGSGTVTASYTVTSSAAPNITYRIIKNGAMVGSTSTAASFTTPQFTVVAGDVLKLQCNSFFGGTAITAASLLTTVI